MTEHPALPEHTLDHASLASLAADVLAAGGVLRFRAHGNSMAPWILDGDRLEIQSVPLPQLRRGDVLLVRLGPQRVIAHRLIAIQTRGEQQRYCIQGDAGFHPDGWVTGEAILGRVECVQHAGRSRRLSTRRSRLIVWLWLLPGVRRVYLRLSAWLRRRQRFVR